MSLSDTEILEMHELCGAVSDDRLTNAQEARLSHFLKTSEEARTLYFRQMALVASLAEYAGEMQLEAPAVVSQRARSMRSHPWILGVLAAAACVVLTLALWKPRQERATPVVTADEMADSELKSGAYVARVTGVKDCVWQDGTLQPGEALVGGRVLHLQQGLAEITFDSGAQLRLEGPASLDIISAWEAALEKGGLKATVPAQAIGFRLHHNSVEVVDLGTEFSMIADSSGDAEVRVLKGSVEVSPLVDEDPAPVILHESETRRFGKHRHHAQSFEARHRQLARKAALERWKLPANFVHWSFDEWKDGAFAMQTEGLTGAFNHGTTTPALTDGRWGQALHLDGHQHLSLTLPGLSHATSRAVAFWVRVPKDAELSQAQTMLAWPMRSKKFGNRMLEIGWNRNPNLGPLGALRTELGKSYAIGATPLRDGAWHHIAVVFMPVGHDGALQVTQYVDGRLEGTTLRAIRVKQAPTEDAEADMVWLGRSFAKHTKARKPFRGDIDELFITDRALSPSEIVQIMTQNSLRRLEISATDQEPSQVAADF